MNTLQVGDKVPSFTTTDQDGNEVRLSDFEGKKLIVFFYPKASTPGCTAEACNLRDNYKELQDQGFDVLLDDRPLRPGVMFADMELIGIPHRVVVSDKLLADNKLEYRNRRAEESEVIDYNEVVARINA